MRDMTDAERATQEADNEVARAIIRRRDRIEAIPPSPFEGWDTTIFHDGIATYYMTDWDFHTGDHWQAQHPMGFTARMSCYQRDAISELIRLVDPAVRLSEQIARDLRDGTFQGKSP